MVVRNHEPAEVEPREQSLDLPAAAVASQRPTVLGLDLAVAAVGRDQCYAFLGEVVRELVGRSAGRLDLSAVCWLPAADEPASPSRM